MGEVGRYLIEGLGESLYTPKRNPNATHVDGKGNYTDENGTVVPLYTQPNWAQKILSPTAREYAKINNTAGAAQMEAQHQREIQRNLIGSDVDTIPTNQWANPGMREASITDITQPSLRPSSALPEASASGALNTGIVGNTAANNALIGNAVSTQQRSDIPYTTMGIKANDIGSLYQAEHPAIFGSRFNAEVNPNAGTIIPGRAVNPDIRSMEALGYLPSNIGGSRTVNIGGKQIEVPQTNGSSINPLNFAASVPESKLLGVPSSSPNVTPPPQLPPHIQAATNALPGKELEDAENVMKTLGVLHDEELFKGTGREMRRITDQQEKSLLKSRIPLLMKAAQNPNMRPAERELIGRIASQFE